MTYLPKKNFKRVKGKAWIRALKQSAIHMYDGNRLNLPYLKTNTPSLPSVPALLHAGRKGRAVSEGWAATACLSSLQIKHLQQSQLAIK